MHVFILWNPQHMTHMSATLSTRLDRNPVEIQKRMILIDPWLHSLPLSQYWFLNYRTFIVNVACLYYVILVCSLCSYHIQILSLSLSLLFNVVYIGVYAITFYCYYVYYLHLFRCAKIIHHQQTIDRTCSFFHGIQLDTNM